MEDIRDPQVETISGEEVHATLARPRLERQLRRVFAASDFYRRRFSAAGFSAEGWPPPLEELPFTEKAELIADQERHPPFGSNLCVAGEDIRRVHRTSGTTGRPLFLALTRGDIEQTVECGARCFWASGLRPGDMVVNCLNYCMWMGGYTDHQSLERTGAAVVPFGTGNSAALLESVIYLRPTAIHCTPSYLSKLEHLLREQFGMRPGELGLKIGLFGGEPGIQDQKFRRRIEGAWGLKAMNANYGMADVLSMFGAECREQAGLHFMGQGHLYLELIEPASGRGVPTEKGAVGEVVLTNLTKEAQPVVRLRTHDVIEIVDHRPCPCGRTSFRFNVIGRSDDMICVGGVNVFPNTIGEIINGHLEAVTGEFQILLHGPPPVDRLTVRLEVRHQATAERREETAKALHWEFKKRLFFSPDLLFVEEGRLPRQTDKARRIVREYEGRRPAEIPYV